MINPFELMDGKAYGIIFGYVIAVKDKGDANMLLFKKDTTDPSSELIAVAAWAPAEGQSGVDMYGMTKDLKGRSVVCVVNIRQREKDGKRYENYDLKYLIKPPLKQSA